jgi:hypothetical protein
MVGAPEMATSPVAADVYAQHIREAQLAEELEYGFSYIIAQGKTYGHPA